MNELTKRILFAIPAAIILIWLTWIGGFPFKVLIGVIAATVLWEVHAMMSKIQSSDYIILSVLIAVVFWVFQYIPLSTALFLSVFIFLMALWAVYGKERGWMKNRLLTTIFTGFYASFGLSMVVHIRNIGIEMEGFWLVLTLFLMIWGNDVFAYFGGKMFGSKPLAPVISPNKTWEGFFSGFIGAAIGFLITFYLSPSFPLPFWALIPSVVIVSTLGPFGDITESSLKRIAGIKDSSNLLPGHGGFFDRFDSMILSAPFIYILYSALT